MNTEQETALQSARERSADDPLEAFRALRPLLEYPGAELEDPADWRSVFECLANIGESIIGSDFARLLEKVARTPDDPELLYNAGYELIEAGLPLVAATALLRAEQAEPGTPAILAELSVALEKGGHNRDAADHLGAYPHLLDDDFVLRYLYVFNSVLCGEIDRAREYFAGLRPGGEEHEPHMYENVRRMLAAADLIDRPEPYDLRGWHFIIGGGLLLYRSPDGEESMHGRYAFYQDGFPAVRGALELLKRTCFADGGPVRVTYFPDRSSEILGLASGKFFGVEALPATVAGLAEPGLVVVYDSLDVDDPELIEALKERRPEQVLWIHALRWLDDFPVCPDVCTLLHQTTNAPWGERLRINAEGQAESAPAMTEAAAALADRILAANFDPDYLKEIEAVTALRAATAGTEFEAGGSGTRRSAFFRGSPVPSNYFA